MNNLFSMFNNKKKNKGENSSKDVSNKICVPK